MLLTINLCRKPRGGVAMDTFLEEGIFEGDLEGWTRSLPGGEWGRWHPRQSKQYGLCYPIWHLCANDKKMLLPQDIWRPSARKYWNKSVMSTMSLWYPCAVPNLHSCTRQPWSNMRKGTEAERACGGSKLIKVGGVVWWLCGWMSRVGREC